MASVSVPHLLTAASPKFFWLGYTSDRKKNARMETLMTRSREQLWKLEDRTRTFVEENRKHLFFTSTGELDLRRSDSYRASYYKLLVVEKAFRGVVSMALHKCVALDNTVRDGFVTYYSRMLSMDSRLLCVYREYYRLESAFYLRVNRARQQAAFFKSISTLSTTVGELSADLACLESPSFYPYGLD